MSPAELKATLEEEAPLPLLLVDVRLEEDWNFRRVPGALNNCVFEVAFDDRMADIAPSHEVPVCLYGFGDGSLEAQMAAEKLGRLGYKKVFELETGVRGWEAAGYPTEGSEITGAIASDPGW